MQPKPTILPASYALEPGSGYELLSPPGHPAVQRWQPPSHLNRLRPALILLAGETLKLPPLAPAPNSQLRLQFAAGLPVISADGLEIVVRLCTQDGECILHKCQITAKQARDQPREVTLLLPASARGTIELLVDCLPGPQHDSGADWLALLEVVVGSPSDLDLLAARTFRELRIGYESQHFRRAFDHPMYVARRARIRRGIDALIPSERSLAVAGAVENAFDYAHAKLCASLRHKAPDFEARLRDRAGKKKQPIRVLSVGIGMGMVEAALFSAIATRVELTMLDVNDELLNHAAANMPANVAAQRIVADVNEVPLHEGGFDIVMCVSGVHHIVELGRFFAVVREGLADDGELWLIGEQIGLPGNRLDAEALARANRIFTALPARYRRNAWSGQIDPELLDLDHSEATFEGIRSHEIETEASRFFMPLHCSRRNCFLWRLVSPEYVGNYSLNNDNDVVLLDKFIVFERDYYLAGGRPTELHGVYSPLRAA